jgi:signal transduction protein with GAF and PtsI domain
MASKSKMNMEAFKKAVRLVCQADSLDTMANGVVQLIAAEMGFKGSAVFFLNPDYKELEMLASFGLSPTYLTKGTISADKSFAQNLKGELFFSSDVTKDKSVQYPEKAKQEGIASIVSVPIIFSGDVLGVLRIYHGKVWTPSEEDMDSFATLGLAIGTAMAGSRLLNALQTVAEVTANVLPSKQ